MKVVMIHLGVIRFAASRIEVTLWILADLGYMEKGTGSEPSI